MSDAHAAHGDDHGHDHGGHGGSRFIQHHYDDAQHQFDAGKLGIWLFLAQEVLFFSALFVAYVLYRVHHPEIYEYAHKYLDVKFGAINTGVLIFSSLTAAWAVRCAQLNQRKRLILCISVTIACAFTFLGIKYIEYSHKFHEHLLPGKYFDPCVSAGGEELVTKRNECPGSKGSVNWNFGTDEPDSGCYDGIDQDPELDGVQADCVVKEVPISKDKDGKEVEHLDQAKVIADRCPVEIPGFMPATPTKEAAVKHPCWLVSEQPFVCKKGVGIVVAYGDTEEREDIHIVATCKKSPVVAAPADVFANPTESVALGQKTMTPRHQLTREEEFEKFEMGPPPEHTNMFFTIYFAMTGLHGIHVFVGILVFIWLLVRSIKGHFTPDYFGPIDFAALYWHIVDLIWIFLFPLLYLIH
ncbi:MAG TPA: cytochrome c oxidase subunit 3 [Kofleriaceae bacterium]